MQDEIAGPILDEVRQRLTFLDAVGLEYLTLDRLASTLSGGEAQRIQLATSLGSRLVGALYVLDEPSIGLHTRDTERLIRILKELRDLGNTIVVVEHDADVLRAADHLLDLGPGAGEFGGKVLAEGVLAEIEANPNSLTGRYLSGKISCRRGGECPGARNWCCVAPTPTICMGSMWRFRSVCWWQSQASRGQANRRWCIRCCIALLLEHWGKPMAATRLESSNR
jgi:hypothetical protein